MCGIVAYVGDGQAGPLLLEGLRRLEYRGYDSAGIGILNGEGTIQIVKEVGRIEELERRANLMVIGGSTGIAHTRWATHGGVTRENAHPQYSCNGEIAVVHNGIIENHQELRRELEAKGHRFASETDTEVVAHLMEEVYRKRREPMESVREVAQRLQGAYALAILFEDRPGMLVGVREEAPLVVGLGVGENFLASDALGFVGHTDRAIFLDNREIARLTKDEVTIYGFDGQAVRKPVTQIAWEVSSVSRKEFEHYTLKEIHEQKETVRQAFQQAPEDLGNFVAAVRRSERVYVTGCGSSFHAALLAKQLFNVYGRIPVEVILSSEFDQYEGLMDRGSLLIALSQSGETADVLAAVKAARNRGATVCSIVNTPGSSLVRLSSCVLLNNCGPEIGVAATKSFTSQLMILSRLSLVLGDRGAELSELDTAGFFVEKVLTVEPTVREVAERFQNANDFYFVGRSLNYPLALEGALKLKELSYIHAEGMAAGELKHGSLALISDGVPVVVLNPEDQTYHDTLSNASEVKARGGRIIGVSSKRSPIYDEFIPIPTAAPVLTPILESVPLQLLAYHASLCRRQNPDYPRNLAKSVTVK